MDRFFFIFKLKRVVIRGFEKYCRIMKGTVASRESNHFDRNRLKI